MQWLQAAAAVFYTDFLGLSVEQAGGSRQFETATWLSIAAVLVLAVGMRLALLRSPGSQHGELVREANRINITNAFFAYLVTFVIALVAERIAFTIPALTQPIYALITLKWAAVFIVGYCALEQRTGYMFVAIIVLLEVGVGLLGFFGAFKNVFFVLLVVAMTSSLALRGRRLVVTVSVLVALFFFGVVWSAIKADYRDFLNQGSEQQVVVVSAEESAGKLADLMKNFTWDNFTQGLESMILRVSYTQMFALTLINVPDSVPYEHGALWLGTIEHILTPRLFFPQKAAISDSERASLYTGLQVAGEERGTSIGIGYVAESYVDFGPIFMFLPILLLGLFYGLIYRFYVVRSESKLICSAIGSAILIFNAYTIETSNVKLVGGTITVLLVVGVLYFMFRNIFRVWLERGSG